MIARIYRLRKFEEKKVFFKMKSILISRVYFLAFSQAIGRRDERWRPLSGRIQHRYAPGGSPPE